MRYVNQKNFATVKDYLAQNEVGKTGYQGHSGRHEDCDKCKDVRQALADLSKEFAAKADALATALEVAVSA